MGYDSCYEGRIGELYESLKQSNKADFISDFDRAVNSGCQKALNYIANGDQDVDVVMARIEVKTDFSTIQNEMYALVDQYREDDDNYLEEISNMLDGLIGKFNSYELIEVEDSFNSLKYFKALNDYKRAIVYAIQCVGFFIDTLHSVEQEKNDIFDTSNIATSILDFTTAYMEVLEMEENIPIKRYS